MNSRTLGRRGALSGGLAIAAARVSNASRGHGIAYAAPSHQSQESALVGACDTPFRAAFEVWLRTESSRFALPLAVGTATCSHTKLHIQGVHPAISVSLVNENEINISVDWDGVWWDMLVWLDAYAEPGPDGVGWLNEALLPEFQIIHPTRETLWRVDVFEELLKWINKDLTHATHLAMWGTACSCTWAQLVRDGKVLRTGRPLNDNGGMPAHLLPVHDQLA